MTDNEASARVTALDLPMMDPLPERTAKYFAVCEDKLGLVPNVLKAYAFDEAKLNAFTALYHDLMLAPSGLSKAEREMIAVAVSAVNPCQYCLTAHGAGLRELTGDPVLAEEIAQNWRGADLTDKQKAMLAFAETLTRTPFTVTENDREALRQVGWSERDIFDIASVAAFFNMSNRVASATDMRPNPEYHGAHR